MTIRFNGFNSNYNIAIEQNVINKHQKEDSKKTQELKEPVVRDVVFKGLENETDLLTKNTQVLCGVNWAKFTLEDKDLADETNAILASLGYNYKVSATQVASVNKNMRTIILPGLKDVEDAAVASHIQDPNGPFSDLFA